MIRVLVVSDYPVARAGLRAIVESAADLRLAGECRGDELAAETAALRPDVVLLDLAAAEPAGRGALWQLSAELSARRSAPAVVVLGAAAPDLARPALAAGARGYLLRDGSPEEIVAAVRVAHLGLTVLHPAAVQSLLGGTGSPAAPAEPGEALTPRELEVLRLLAEGLPSKSIAARLRISEHTVKFHVGSILGKLGAASRTEALALAVRRGLIAL